LEGAKSKRGLVNARNETASLRKRVANRKGRKNKHVHPLGCQYGREQEDDCRERKARGSLVTMKARQYWQHARQKPPKEGSMLEKDLWLKRRGLYQGRNVNGSGKRMIGGLKG